MKRHITPDENREDFGDFQGGELGEALAEGEQSIAKEGTLDGDEAFWLRRERRRQCADANESGEF